MQNIVFLIPFVFSQFELLISSCIPSVKQCGCSYQQPILSKLRIIGGYTARKNSWPWIVSIRQTDIYQSLTDPGVAVCGGTLISDKYVLTAAHCFYDINHLLLSHYFVVVGAHFINDTNPIRYKIKSILLHEKYDDDFFLNDIALIELSREVDLNNSDVGFICLPPNNVSTYPYEQLSGIAAGWGRLGENSSASYILQQVHLPIISNRNQFCIRQTSDDRMQFCAGFIQGGRDTCQGDSGGPLMIYDTNTDIWHIAGITSYGYGCARAEYPGVYTRVSMFIDWIDEHINCSSQLFTKQMWVKILMLLLCIILFV